MSIAEHALLDATGTVLQILVVDEADPDSMAVLEHVVGAKDGPYAQVASTVRADLRAAGLNRPAPGRKKRADGTWRADDELPRGDRREFRAGDLPGQPTGRLLDDTGAPKSGTALAATSGPPPGAGSSASAAGAAPKA